MNRPTYAEACRTFRWEDSFKALEWTPAGDVNLGHTILDRHAGVAERRVASTITASSAL